MPDIFVSREEKKEGKTPKVQPDIHEPVINEELGQGAEKRRLHRPDFNEVRKELGSKEGIPLMQYKRPLSAFMFYPDGIEFENREEQEKVVLFLRQHPIVNIPWILLAIVMVFAPGLVSGFATFSEIPANFVFIFILIWYLFITAFVLEKFLTWFFNVYIVTDERIVDVDFYNLIYKEVSDTKLDRIQDVTYNMGGVVRQLFNYGNVLIQTASEVPNFEFTAVPRPDKVVRILQDLQVEEEQEKLEGRVR